MYFFSKVQQALLERFRDHTRDDVWGSLRALGIQAQMSGRGRPEEKILSLGQQSLGVIEIVEGPIRWINVRTIPIVAIGLESERHTYELVYGVPDPKVQSGFPEVRLEAIDVIRWGLVSIGVRWQGKDFGLRLIDRLNDDVSPKPIMDKCDLEIAANPEHSCWIVTAGTPGSFPSKVLWDCIQSLARHLLAMPVPPNT